MSRKAFGEWGVKVEHYIEDLKGLENPPWYPAAGDAIIHSYFKYADLAGWRIFNQVEK